MAAALREVDLYVTVPYAGATLTVTNLTGHPSLIARCGITAGKSLPIEFIGGLFREDAILRAGMFAEREKEKWPDVESLPDLP